MSTEGEIRFALAAFARKYGPEDLYGDLPILNNPERLETMLHDLSILFTHLRLLGYDAYRHRYLPGNMIIQHLNQILWALRSATNLPFAVENRELISELDRQYQLIFLG